MMHPKTDTAPASALRTLCTLLVLCSLCGLLVLAMPKSQTGDIALDTSIGFSGMPQP